MFDFLNSANLWRYLVYFWTLVFYTMAIGDFVKDNALVKFLGPLAAIYIGILAVYAGQKEFERWCHMHDGRHPGEFFVIGWTILVFSFFALDFILRKPYVIPDVLIYTYITVLGVLAITMKSKKVYRKKHK